MRIYGSICRGCVVSDAQGRVPSVPQNRDGKKSQGRRPRNDVRIGVLIVDREDAVVLRTVLGPFPALGGTLPIQWQHMHVSGRASPKTSVRLTTSLAWQLPKPNARTSLTTYRLPGIMDMQNGGLSDGALLCRRPLRN